MICTKKMKTVGLWTALWLPLGAVAQTSFRCKNDLASTGDSKLSVLQKCGEPVAKDSFCKPVSVTPAKGTTGTAINVNACEQVDEWTYNPGYGQFMTTLRFEQGKLASIKYGDRVK